MTLIPNIALIRRDESLVFFVFVFLCLRQLILCFNFCDMIGLGDLINSITLVDRNSKLKVLQKHYLDDAESSKFLQYCDIPFIHFRNFLSSKTEIIC